MCVIYKRHDTPVVDQDRKQFPSGSQPYQCDLTPCLPATVVTRDTVMHTGTVCTHPVCVTAVTVEYVTVECVTAEYMTHMSHVPKDSKCVQLASIISTASVYIHNTCANIYAQLLSRYTLAVDMIDIS
jgi:hypothetical protein